MSEFTEKVLIGKYNKIDKRTKNLLINKLDNSSFENDFSGWDLGAGTQSIDTTIVLNGAKSLKIANTGSGNYRFKDMVFPNGHKIYASAYSYLESATDPSHINVKERFGVSDYESNSANIVRNGFSSEIGVWDRKSLVKTISNGGIRLSLGRNQTQVATYYFDNLLVIDMTDIFGEGNELTASEMDAWLLAIDKLWFDKISIQYLDRYNDNYWYNKTMNIIGDSITAHYPNEENFSVVTANKLGMTLNNYGISGSMIAIQESSPTTRDPIVTRYSSMADGADLIIVAGGTNDFFYGLCPFGDMTSRSSFDFYGAMHNLCSGLIEKYSGKNIMFMTPIKRSQSPLLTQESVNANGKTLKEYCDAIKQVCAYYGIPVLDMHSECILIPQIAGQNTAFFIDGTHPNEEGHAIMSRSLVAFLKRLA